MFLNGYHQDQAVAMERLGYMIQKRCQLIFLVSIICIFTGVSHAETIIKHIRFGNQSGNTRIVLDLNKKAVPSAFLLDNPARIVIDFKNGRYDKTEKIKAMGVVSGYRHGLFDQNTYRLVLDLKQKAIIVSQFYLSPTGSAGHRYVLDLGPSNDQLFSEAVQLSKKQLSQNIYTPKTSESAIPAKPVIPKGAKKLIVIDPGHGGPDPGTLGVLGVNEEHIVLNIAFDVKKKLEATGRYTVRLTRDRDVYLPHRRRFQIAREIGADLFISIHADSIANSSVRGGTVYTLNEDASDKESARLAARENKSDALAGVDLSTADDQVSSILIDLAQRQTMNTSANFAELLVSSMREEVKMHRRGHRFASLLVLKSPDVPSVLVETGYLSNKEDAKMLNSQRGRRKIANGILKGVDRFFKNQETVAR